MQNKIELYKTKEGKNELEIHFDGDSFWLRQNQIAEIFEKDRTVITKHINKILKDNEVDEKSNVQKMHIANSDKPVIFYSLDIVLAVGYRTNSQKAIDFRKWATSVLKKYLTEGYAVNESKITKTKTILNNLKQTIEFLSTKEIGDEKEILTLLQNYTKTLSLLEGYDKANIEDFQGQMASYELTYGEVKKVIAQLKTTLMAKKEASKLFANEKDDQLSGIIGNLYQTFGGVELYPSIEDKATHLLYFIIKDHPFSDGNKRQRLDNINASCRIKSTKGERDFDKTDKTFTI